MTRARVQDFSLILSGLLTDYDRKEMVREIKRRVPTNAYRLGHLLGAAQGAEERAKQMGIWDRDDPEAIMTYLMLLKEHFIYERGQFALAPLRQLQKRMLDWVDKGKLPKYGTAKALENPTAFWGKFEG